MKTIIQNVAYKNKGFYEFLLQIHAFMKKEKEFNEQS